MHQSSMESSKLDCFGNGSLYLLSANFIVGVVLKALKDLSSSHEKQRKMQSRAYIPKENYKKQIIIIMIINIYVYG